MRAPCWIGLIALFSALPLAAQSSCSANALPEAARTVADTRHRLHGLAVPERDARVPPAVAAQLGELKAGLAAAASAAFACANGATSAETLQGVLAGALHANNASAAETAEVRKGKDYGAYGSDLAVQVLELFGRPRFYEVDFRYGVECGDDHLLQVFQAEDNTAASRWQERLRWSAPSYATVGDALGDFFMVTPLTGSYKTPHWRFVVAHGHPGCGNGARASRFDLDLLAPTADPARPSIDWHFEHPYTEDQITPRLATTEDTLDFRILHTPKTGKPSAGTAVPEVFRFHLTSDGQLEPAPAGESDGSAPR